PTITLLVQELSRTLSPAAISPSLRKITRPRGVISRQLTPVTPVTTIGNTGFVPRLVSFRPIGPVPAAPPSRGVVTIDQVSDLVTNRVVHEKIRDHRGPTLVESDGLAIFNQVSPPGIIDRLPDDFIQFLESYRLKSLSG